VRTLENLRKVFENLRKVFENLRKVFENLRKVFELYLSSPSPSSCSHCKKTVLNLLKASKSHRILPVFSQF